MDTLTIAFFISIVLWLAILICFFVLCSDVAKIRKVLRRTDRMDDVRKYVFFSENEKARDALIDEVWRELKKAKVDSLYTESVFNARVEEIKRIYMRYFDQVGAEFPEVDYKTSDLY